MHEDELPTWSLINAVNDGPGPLVYHIRDQERLIKALPMHALASTQSFQTVIVMMDQLTGTLALPEAELAQSLSAPDTSVQGWHWPDGSSLLLMPFAHDGLPGLERIGTPAGSEQLLVASHPMALLMYGDEATSRYAATIDGYVSDTLKLGINISGTTHSSLLNLVAAAATLTITRLT